MRRIYLFAYLAFCLSLFVAPACGGELVMFEQKGCPWCAKWDKEIARIYPKSPEGERLPLRRVDIDGQRPAGLATLGPIRYTPTFVAMEGGKEIGRITGYPGDDMFWGLLGQIMARLPQ